MNLTQDSDNVRLMFIFLSRGSLLTRRMKFVCTKFSVLSRVVFRNSASAPTTSLIAIGIPTSLFFLNIAGTGVVGFGQQQMIRHGFGFLLGRQVIKSCVSLFGCLRR